MQWHIAVVLVSAMALATCIGAINGCAPSPAANIPRGDDRGFAARRARLAQAILDARAPSTQPGAATLPFATVSRSGASLAAFQVRAVAGRDREALAREYSQYIETSPTLNYLEWNKPRNQPDWTLNPLIRTWYLDRRLLSPAAIGRLQEIMRWYRGDIVFGGTENHIVNRTVLTLLVDQALGIHDQKTDAARRNFLRWVYKRGHRGYMEYNSPTYHARVIEPLLSLYDFIEEPQLKAAAQRALDQAMAEAALLSISGARGGPWHRAVNPRAMSDARANVAWAIGYTFFGTVEDPAGDAQMVTTTYRAPQVVVDLARDLAGRGSYVVRKRIDTVKPRLNAYYYMTPAYNLSSFLDRPGYTCWYYGSTNTANLQPWALSFADPTKILGAPQNLTRQANFDESSTSTMQYKNVLFYVGRWMDYNDHLSSPVNVQRGPRTYHFYNIDTPQGGVYVGLIDYPAVKGGILEVGRAGDFASFDVFQQKVVAAGDASTCEANGQRTRYTSTAGDAVEYDHGRATVNGQPFALNDYPLVESPYLNSAWDSGIVQVSYGDKSMKLDFADPSVEAGEGLKGEYFADAQFTRSVLQRRDYTLDYNWGSQPDPLLPAGEFSARWTGSFLSDYTDTHTFTIYTDGRAKLWVDDQLIVDGQRGYRPTTAPAGDASTEPVGLSGTVALKANRRYNFRLEYVHGTGPATVRVTSQSRLCGEGTLGLLGELFDTPAAPAR